MTLGILLVDLQVDFFPGGALPVADGHEVIEPINALLRRHPRASICASRDWHPADTRHFKARGGIWPPHCVQGTAGASFHEAVRMERAQVFDKGTNPEDDAGYSAFEAVRHEAGRAITVLDHLRDDGVDGLFVVGLATDYCVKASVLDAVRHGFTTFLYAPGARAVNIKPDDGAQAIQAMKAAGAFIVE